jgi:hypothetical protein
LVKEKNRATLIDSARQRETDNDVTIRAMRTARQAKREWMMKTMKRTRLPVVLCVECSSHSFWRTLPALTPVNLGWVPDGATPGGETSVDTDDADELGATGYLVLPIGLMEGHADALFTHIGARKPPGWLRFGIEGLAHYPVMECGRGWRRPTNPNGCLSPELARLAPSPWRRSST